MPVSTVETQQATPAALEAALASACQLLRSRQAPEGYWCAELEADTTLESDTIKMWRLLGRVDRQREERLVRTILSQQLPGGGWPIYRDGPAELNATVKAYVALRLSGRGREEPALRRAREEILRLGGLERVNSFEKVYLALLGLYPWDQVPALPPELILLPGWFPFHIYEVSYWSRTILIPLAVVYGLRPSLEKAGFTVEELWVNPRARRAEVTNLQKGGAGWRVFFLAVTELLKLHERLPWKPLRRRALRECDRWMSERLLETDGLGAIFPAMLNAVFAFKALAEAEADPKLERSIREMERLELSDGDALKVQPCFSPVWDTSLAMYVLAQAQGALATPALERAFEWLKASEVRIWGDWRIKNPRGRPGGWAFGFRNPFYPDVDDTAQVLLALQALFGKAASFSLGPFQRGLGWLLSMQNKDGGWSSFDKDNDCLPLTHFPFADHNAMLDPSACDITGRILELLAGAGFSEDHPAVRRAVGFLRKRQEPDGTWFGRWGVSWLYGTWLALRGLKAAGEAMEEPRYQRAADWLLKHQNPDGGWGESCRSYDDPSLKGQGASTPSQTAWALLTLISLERTAQPGFRRGLDHLLASQRPDGAWDEALFTGTGFPRVFYLRYDFYRMYFPILALTEARELLK